MRNVLDHLARWIRSTYEPGVDDPWWKDNIAHFLAGVAIASATALVTTDSQEMILVFMICAIIWEWFEHAYNIRPWDEREDWSFDRAVEDTILDTLLGLAGVYLVLLIV